ncbi:MAG: YifB family Mg chelatase-like AAA ATPase [Tissierellia bacterium]|nr:YifB family Mg chelatase-like AAA ATPase [Tissierellia bacterium]
MYSKISTCVLQGLSGHIVEVETDLSRGMPVFNIVGLADTAIKESKERVRSAIKNSGYGFPLNRITINLAPAHLRKEGSQMDLAIALGILISSGMVDYDQEDTVFLGELSLDGKLNPIEGALPMVLSLRDFKIKRCIVPYDNREECSVIDDMEIIPLRTLREVVDYLKGKIIIEPYKGMGEDSKEKKEYELDFSDIRGQDSLKRALEVAAAGGHNALILGPPGSGKTMAIRRLPTILPDLSLEESIEVTKIYSIAGLLKSKGLIKERPFRSPHHTISAVSLIGGGRNPKPGEVSLAHNGVLFLDELAEFDRRALDSLRQPMEDGQVNISRIYGTYTFPSKFMLVAALNPCPCGYYGDPYHDCSCSPRDIDRYLNKISQPLLDRMDIHMEVLPVKYQDLSRVRKGESSLEIKKRVSMARQIQLNRFKDEGIYTNAQIPNKLIPKYCSLSSSSERIMDQAFKKYKFSARTYHKILKVARTIADLEGKESIMDHHILEAIGYRSLRVKYWG